MYFCASDSMNRKLNRMSEQSNEIEIKSIALNNEALVILEKMI